MNVLCAIRRRLAREDRDAGTALLLVIFVVLVLSGLSLLVLGTITSRIRPAVAAEKRAITLAAAESGVQAGLAAIKNSISVDLTDAGKVTGDRNMLPCWSGHKGTITAADTKVEYAATITYFITDPSRQSDAWRSSNAMACRDGQGPSSGPPNYALPKYALISADGLGRSVMGNDLLGNRRMEAVYTFSLSNINITGGSLSLGGLCFDAGTKPYDDGRRVAFRTCDPSLFSQMWSHRSDFTIQLSESAASGGVGKCLAMDPADTTTTYPTPVRIQPCDSSKATQRWGFDDNRALYARPTNVWTDGKWCVSNSSGLVVAGPSNKNCSGVVADPKLGSGAAGSTSDDVSDKPLQWVNYQRFGRCYDITDWILNSSPYPTGRPWEILYNCKQDPMRDFSANAQPGWNQVMTWSSSTKLFHVDANVDTNGFNKGNGPTKATYPDWCMKSPNAEDKPVIFDPTCASGLAQFQWTVNRNTGVAATSYTIVDGYGRCLAAGEDYPADTRYKGLYSIVTRTCDGSASQKWNAPPIVKDVPVTNIRERVIS